MTARTILFFLSTFAFCVSGYAQESPSAKAARLLNESGLKYSKLADGIWTVPFEGKTLKTFDVLIATTDEVMLMFVITAESKKFKVTSELMQKLLRLNTDFDRVKIGIDKSGDLITRIDVGLRLLDKREFQENLDQTAAAADEVYSAVKPFLIAAK